MPIPTRRRAARINYAWPGTFDSVNPFIVQGSGARGSLDLVFGNNVFETLMMRSSDEPFTLYPLLAEDGRDGRRSAASSSSRWTSAPNSPTASR